MLQILIASIKGFGTRSGIFDFLANLSNPIGDFEIASYDDRPTIGGFDQSHRRPRQRFAIDGRKQQPNWQRPADSRGYRGRCRITEVRRPAAGASQCQYATAVLFD